LRKAAAMHDPPPLDPFVTLSRSEEGESGIIQHPSLMLQFIIIHKYGINENRSALNTFSPDTLMINHRIIL
jgi:hypothetical protein